MTKPVVVDFPRGRMARKQIRAKVLHSFRSQSRLHKNLLLQAVELNVFGHWKPMSEELAEAVVVSYANQSWKKQQRNELLFQAWFKLGNRRFWRIMESHRIPKAPAPTQPEIYSYETVLYIPAQLYHMTAKRDGRGRRAVRTYPRSFPCSVELVKVTVAHC